MSDLILEMVEGEDPGRKIALTGPLDVGREPSLSLALEDVQTSRRHARFSRQGAQVVVEDLGSTNGTFVNDQPIHGPRAIVPGDRVRTGLTVFQLRDSAQVAAQPSAVRPIPQGTVLGQVIAAPEPAVGAPVVPGLLAIESEPAFVPRDVIGDPEGEANYMAVQRLADVRVKRRTNLAVFALLGAAGLAVALAFGLK